jgi:hypothetical protein
MTFAKPSSISMLSSASGIAKNKKGLKCTNNTLFKLKNTNLSNPKREEGTIPSSGHGGDHVLEVVHSRSASMAYMSFSSALAM